jgi:hypothetical protein
VSSFLQGQPRVPMFDKGSGNFTGNFTPAWAGWFSQAQTILFDTANSGTTAQRPTTLLYIGKTYFDTTLGIPIWMKTPATNTWVNGAGAVV